MLFRLNIVVVIFFVSKFILYMSKGLNTTNEFATAEFMAYNAIIDTFDMLCLLFVFRPRKRWPEYFSFRLGDHAQMRNNRPNR